MFIKRQDSINKELVKHFPTEYFAWIDDICLEKEEDEHEKEHTEDNLVDRVSAENVINIDKENIT